MNALAAAGGDDASGTTPLNTVERIAIKVLLAGLGLALGALAGIAIALFTGLIELRC